MNRFSIIVFNLFILIFSASAEYRETLCFTFNEADFSFHLNESNQLVISTEKLNHALPEGNEPWLPFCAYNIAVPCDVDSISFSATYSKRQIKTDVTMASAPKPIATNQKQVSGQTDTITYDTSSVYPSEICALSNTSQWEAIKLLHFTVCPFTYDASTKTLFFIDSISLTISSNKSQSTVSNSISYNPLNHELVKELAFNKAQVDSIIAISTTSSRTPILSDTKRIDYLIITNELLKPAFNHLIAWKKKKGLYARIATIEEIVKYSTGNDTQLKIKNFIKELYDKHSLTYVLLGGDDTIIPVRGCYGRYDNTTDNTIPTDLFYACFGGDFAWDANMNGIYGEGDDNIDLGASVYLTRVPVRTEQDAESFIKKVIEYEKDPKWNNNILMCGAKIASNLVNSQSDAEAKGDNMFENYIRPYWDGKRYKFYDTFTDFPNGADYDFTASNLYEQIKNGYSFIDVCTHGSQPSWAMEKSVNYHRDRASTQTNVAHSIITTIACLTNAFDSSSKGGDLDPCLSESFIRNPQSGVIAYLGSSRFGWDNFGKSLGASSQYTAIFYKNLFSSSSKNKQFGYIVAATKADRAAYSGDYNALRWVQFGLNPIGDPEMPIYTTVPKYFNNFQITKSSIGIKIDSGVSGTRICVMDVNEEGNAYYKVFNDTQAIELSDLPTECSICFSKQGFASKPLSIKLFQNETIENSQVYDYDIVIMGSNLTSQKGYGPVVFKGGEITIKAYSISIENDTFFENGATIQFDHKTDIP